MDAAETARGEPLVVGLVSAGGPGKHDVVTVLSPGHTTVVSLGVVGRAEVVTHLVGHGHMGHSRGHVLAVVHQGDDAGVQTLVAPAIVLKI